MKTFWVRWYEREPATFEYHGPWWVSGYAPGLGDDVDDTTVICAAVMAPDEDAAKLVIERAHDSKDDSTIAEWSFVNEKPDGWAPWQVGKPGETPRFGRADWMQWPNPEAVSP